jgi:hypothetical protein
MVERAISVFHFYLRSISLLFLIPYSLISFVFAQDTSIVQKDFKKKEGYFFSFDFGYLSGVGQLQNYMDYRNSYHTLSIRNINGYRFDEHLQAGVGIGYEMYRSDSDLLVSKEYIPLFLNVRFLFTLGKNYSAGLCIDIGNNFSSGYSRRGYLVGHSPGGYATRTDEYLGGHFYSAGVCIRKWLGDGKNSCWICLGYEKQNNKINSTDESQIWSQPSPSVSKTTDFFHSEFLVARAAFEF